MPIAAALPYIAAGTSLVGTAAGIAGQRQQRKDNAAARAQNAANEQSENDSRWQSYLMQRGLDPMGASAGQMPSATRALNVKLPLYANVNVVRSPNSTAIRGLTRSPSGPSSTWWRPPEESSRAATRSWAGLGFGP